MVPDIPVDGSGKFVNGRAQAEADVEVVLQDGQTTIEQWREQVELGL
jgi:NaMN:DMB phosphoribosyltransferase